MFVAIRSASLFKCCIRTGVVISGFKSLVGWAGAPAAEERGLEKGLPEEDEGHL